MATKNRNRKAILPLLAILMLLSCNREARQTNTQEGTASENTDASSVTPESKSKYLNQNELTDFVQNTLSVDLSGSYTSPFDSFEFNKVIAYDFEGGPPYLSVIDDRNGRFEPVVLRQKALNAAQVDYLLQFITDSNTYGEQTFSCFDPHLGIVFFQGERIKYVIDICLDCNYLQATAVIPATQYHKKTFEDGTSYALKGFSDVGKQHIIELSRQLGLDYGEVNLEELKNH